MKTLSRTTKSQSRKYNHRYPYVTKNNEVSLKYKHSASQSRCTTTNFCQKKNGCQNISTQLHVRRTLQITQPTMFSLRGLTVNARHDAGNVSDMSDSPKQTFYSISVLATRITFWY